ncbi:CAP domain-containing protein [Marinobacter hydrocarbonoclasticus]|nr:CAP domain-containing protein [Marinobacter nauticus]
MSLAIVFAAVTVAVPLECGLHPKARELARLIIVDPEQKRPALRCDGLLAMVAQEKAREMAERKHVSHLGEGGPNARVANAGYPLDRRYDVGLGNQIEAVAGGYSEAAEMWEAFKASSGHRTHLLGEQPVYREQDEISVGYYFDWEAPHIDYWVVYVARKDDHAPEPIVLISKPGGFTVELE